MKARSRNNALIFLCLLAFVALRFVDQRPDESIPSWDWRETSDGPTSALEEVTAEGFSPVRVVGSATDLEVRTAAELLWSTGLLGVRVGPPGESSSSSREVWVLPGSEDCSTTAAALAHVAGGGALVAWSPCEDLLLGLGGPTRVPYRDSPGQTAFVESQDGEGPLPLPLSATDFEFGPTSMGNWNELVARSGGGSVVLSAPRAALFSFDLSAWLRELRQGNPELSGQDRDGLHGPKPNDLRPFAWAEPIWRQPFSELWAEVLVAEVSRLAAGSGALLPRIWALPTTASSALVLTSDQDFAESDWMDSMLARTEERGGEMTLLSTAGTRQKNSARAQDSGGIFLSEAALQRAKSWGHGLGMHPNPAGLSSSDEMVEAVRESYRRSFDILGESPRVVRNHYLSWWDAEEPMEVYAELGLWMELNYVSIQPAFEAAGFLFGSARPARFLAKDRTLPLLSQATQLEDDVLTGEFAYSLGLSSAGAVEASARLLDVAVRNRIPVVANLHPLWVVQDRAEFLDGLLDAAKARDLPIISAERWATQSWDRLRLVMTSELRLADGAWVPVPSAKHSSGVPQWLWTPAASECASESRPSPLSVGGCLVEWGRP